MSGIGLLQCQNCFAPLNVKGATSGIIVCDFCGTQNAMPSEVRRIQADDSHGFVVALLRAMQGQVSLSDVQLICPIISGRVRFTVDFENLGGSGANDKKRELILLCQRRGILQELVDALLEVNPRFEVSL